MPLRAQRLHGVGVTVEVDDLLVFGRHTVERIAHDPHEVAVVVEPHVVGVAHGFDVDDRVAQEVQATALVVREPGTRVAALVDGPIDLVGRNADGLLQDANGRAGDTARRARRPCDRVLRDRGRPDRALSRWTSRTSAEYGGEIGDLRGGEQRHDHVHLLVRFASHSDAEPVHHACAHLGADVGRQAVQIQRRRRSAPCAARRRSTIDARR